MATVKTFPSRLQNDTPETNVMVATSTLYAVYGQFTSNKVKWGDTQKAEVEISLHLVEYIGCVVSARSVWWLSRVSTVGSGRPWNSGSQSLPPPRGHRRWEPSPGGHKAGQLMCWCRRGRTLSCQTPGWVQKGEAQVRRVTDVLFRQFWFPQTNLDPTVSPIGNYDISIGIHSHACGSVKLAVPFSVRAKFKEELPICIVHLSGRLNMKGSGWMVLSHKDEHRKREHKAFSLFPALLKLQMHWCTNFAANALMKTVLTAYQEAKHYFKMKNFVKTAQNKAASVLIS